MGFAFDGDADRCLAVDENGSVVNGDKSLYVCARNMQTEGRFGNSKVVTTVMSNLGLYLSLIHISHRSDGRHHGASLVRKRYGKSKRKKENGSARLRLSLIHI